MTMLNELNRVLLGIFQAGLEYGHAQAMRGATLESAIENGKQAWEKSAIAATDRIGLTEDCKAGRVTL